MTEVERLKRHISNLDAALADICNIVADYFPSTVCDLECLAQRFLENRDSIDAEYEDTKE